MSLTEQAFNNNIVALYGPRKSSFRLLADPWRTADPGNSTRAALYTAAPATRTGLSPAAVRVVCIL